MTNPFNLSQVMQKFRAPGLEKSLAKWFGPKSCSDLIPQSGLDLKQHAVKGTEPIEKIVAYNKIIAFMKGTSE